MYRWHKDRARTLRVQRRYKDTYGGGWYYKGRVRFENQPGRFRKNSGIGCPIGRHCNYCSRMGKTHQEVKADVDLAEQVEELRHDRYVK